MQFFLVWNFSDAVKSKVLLPKQDYFKTILRLNSEKKKKGKKEKKNDIKPQRKLWYSYEKSV